MAIPNSRTNERGAITIDQEKCNGCGLCVEVCKDFDLEVVDGKARVSGEGIFECFACGHCMMVCPQAAIHINGRLLSPDDIFPIPERKAAATYESLMALYQRRRSIREYNDTAVPADIIEKVIQAAKTAPMGIPPSDVHLLVLDSKEKSFRFAQDFCNYLKKLKWMVTPVGLLFIRLIYGKETADIFKHFVKILIEKYISSMDSGKNAVTYNAPAALYFYGSPYSDPADPIIAATYAMHAAESLGLGTCMIGGVHPFTLNGQAAKKFRKKWSIKYKSKEGLIIIMGYPKIKFRASVKRSLAEINFIST